jgi:hypothetical protein
LQQKERMLGRQSSRTPGSRKRKEPPP